MTALKDFSAFALTIFTIVSVSIFSLTLIDNINTRKMNLAAYTTAYTSVLSCRAETQQRNLCGNIPDPKDFNFPTQPQINLDIK